MLLLSSVQYNQTFSTTPAGNIRISLPMPALFPWTLYPFPQLPRVSHIFQPRSRGKPTGLAQYPRPCKTLAEKEKMVSNLDPGQRCNKTTYHLHHFWIIKVIDNVFQDVTIRHKAESSKHNDDGNFLLYVWQDGNNTLTDCTFTCTLKHITTQCMHTRALFRSTTAFLSHNGSVLSLFGVYVPVERYTEESCKENWANCHAEIIQKSK